MLRSKLEVIKMFNHDQSNHIKASNDYFVNLA